MLEFAKAGLGEAVVAHWTVADSFRNGALIPVKIGRGGLHRTWNAVWLRTHPQQACIDAFARLLRSQAGRN
jgi:DNA-binding transcriptional LysR family regulator